MVVISYLNFGTTYRSSDRLSRNTLVKILKIKTQHKIKIYFLVVYTFDVSLLTLSSPNRVVILLFYVTVQVSVFTSRPVT